MAFCTIGVSKQKGGSVGASGRHNDRGREVPNADPDRTHLNRVLIGDDRNARERVREIIDEHGGKPRRDSVEAVELLLSASHEYFVGPDGEINSERLEPWVGQATKFLGDRRNCGICAKAVLHLDERKPPTFTPTWCRSRRTGGCRRATSSTGVRRCRSCTRAKPST